MKTKKSEEIFKKMQEEFLNPIKFRKFLFEENDELAVTLAEDKGIISGSPLAYFIDGFNTMKKLNPNSMKAPDNVNKLAEDYAPVTISDYQKGMKQGFIAGFTAASNKTAAGIRWVKGAPDKLGIYFCYVKWDDESELREVVTVIESKIKGLIYAIGSTVIGKGAITQWLNESDSPASGKWTENMRKALEKIAKWELPKTGEFWDKEKTRELTYEAAYGSNGARDYIRQIATDALKFNPSAGERETVKK